VIPIEAPADSQFAPFRLMGLSLLWRDPSRNLALTLEDPTGFSMPLTVDAKPLSAAWHDGLYVYGAREDSSRGTAKIDVYIAGDQMSPPPLPTGTWKLHVVDPSAPGSDDLVVIGAVIDDSSRWSKGIYFSEFPNEEHLIGFPATADHGLAVAAYTGHDFVYGGKAGERAFYSGRGHRIDGAKILSISAPDDPVTAGVDPALPATTMLFGGTSGASPHVAGAAALLIQANPTLSGDDVRSAIEQSALADGFVGAAPNEDYGHGKLRVYNAIYGKDPPGGGPPSIAVAPRTIEVGAPARIPVTVSDPDEGDANLVLEIDRDYDGTYDERLSDGSFDVRFDDAGDHVAKLRVTDSSGKQASTLVVITAEQFDDPPEPKSHAPRALRADGGGCTTGSGPQTGSAAWLMAALLAARAWRRKERR
jgi:MYXO-CTERM domain-containing protein